jgi:hypothetical protein
MSSILLPPPQQPSEPPEPGHALSAPPTALVVAPPRAQQYEPERPQPSRFWRVVKWPLRKLFLILYVIGSGIKRHRLAAVAVLALLVLVGGGTYGLYRVTHPPTVKTTAGSTRSTQPETPFTINSAAAAPLPNAVIVALHAEKTFNAQEFWNSLSPQFQAYLKANQLDESALEQIYAQGQAAGVVYDQFIYVGGYLAVDGAGNYTVEAVFHVGQQAGIDIWYFTVDPKGQISYFQSLPRTTPSTTSTTAGP